MTHSYVWNTSLMVSLTFTSINCQNMDKTGGKSRRKTCCDDHTLKIQFKAESDKRYFAAAKYQHIPKQCYECNILLSDTKGANQFVPSIDKPAYLCENCPDTCSNALCFQCFTNKSDIKHQRHRKK